MAVHLAVDKVAAVDVAVLVGERAIPADAPIDPLSFVPVAVGVDGHTVATGDILVPRTVRGSTVKITVDSLSVPLSAEPLPFVTASHTSTYLERKRGKEKKKKRKKSLLGFFFLGKKKKKVIIFQKKKKKMHLHYMKHVRFAVGVFHDTLAVHLAIFNRSAVHLLLPF